MSTASEATSPTEPPAPTQTEDSDEPAESDEPTESDTVAMEESDNDNSIDATEEAEIDGVTVIPIGASGHVDGPVEYTQFPPAGGDHNPGWQNCGFYTVELPNEQAVHSLEHGAVWVAYSPDATSDELTNLETLVGGSTHLLASPYAGMEDTFTLTAWGRQATISSLSDPLFTEFVSTYMGSGPTTPEPGAVCSSAYGIPPTDTQTIG